MRLFFDWPSDWHALRSWLRQPTTWLLLAILSILPPAAALSSIKVDTDFETFRRFNQPILAHELAMNEAERLASLGSKPEAMRQQFHTDFFFIATYTAAFVFAGILAMRRGVPAGRWLILLALAVAAADCLENYLGLQESLQMRTVSRIKWVLFAPVCGIIALAYWPRAGTFLFRIFQWTAAAAAAVAAVLFAIGFLGPDWERFWQGAASALAIWFVTEIPVLILWPDQILGRTVIKDTDIF